jgi:probable phosphoglycerate mutase
MLLYIIRHGEATYVNEQLTELGKQQADALANRLCIHGFDEIYTSPLRRAIQTAQPTAERLGISGKIESWMEEDIAYEDFSATNLNGKEHDWSFACQNTKLLAPHEKWYDNPVFATCKNIAGGHERITKASDDFIARLGYVRDGFTYKIVAPSEKRIGVFCHHGMGTTWLSHLLQIPPNIFWASFNIAHTGVTVLEWANNPDGRTAPQCICLSDISHAYKENIPVNLGTKIFGRGK